MVRCNALPWKDKGTCVHETDTEGIEMNHGMGSSGGACAASQTCAARRSGVFAGLLALVIGGVAIQSASAQSIEDHSLPKSVIKTYHVKCGNGRLGIVRYDTRQDPTRVCTSVQDGSKAPTCTSAPSQEIGARVRDAAQQVCR